jgi:hypothetical protein
VPEFATGQLVLDKCSRDDPMDIMVASFRKLWINTRLVRLAWLWATVLLLASPTILAQHDSDAFGEVRLLSPSQSEQTSAATLPQDWHRKQGRPTLTTVGQATTVTLTGIDKPEHIGFPLAHGALSPVSKHTFERMPSAVFWQMAACAADAACPSVSVALAAASTRPTQVSNDSDRAVEDDHNPNENDSNCAEFSLPQAVDTPTSRPADPLPLFDTHASPPDKPPPTATPTTPVMQTHSSISAPDTPTSAVAAAPPRLIDTLIPTPPTPTHITTPVPLPAMVTSTAFAARWSLTLRLSGTRETMEYSVWIALIKSGSTVKDKKCSASSSCFTQKYRLKP